MSRESAIEKGRRYASEGRLVIRSLDEESGIVQADCRGDGAIYSLGRDERGWWCSCPALGRCAHLYALGLVCALEPRETAR
jgi:uncharacterized Zn finger protein